jgi:hypothetical protein
VRRARSIEKPNKEREREREREREIGLLLKRLGLTSTLLHSMGAASIAGSQSLWGRSAAVSDKDAKARAERLAIFVGLWPPTSSCSAKPEPRISARHPDQAGLRPRRVPPAMSDEGEKGADVRYVLSGENQSASSVMRHQLAPYCNEQRFIFERWRNH